MAYISQYSGETIDNAITDVQQLQQIILNTIYPVGSLYTSFNATNPTTLIGGTWEQIQDCFLMAAGSTYAAGTSGGAASHTHTSAAHTHTTAGHTLTISEIPSHSHTYKSAPHLFAEIDTSANNVIKPNTSGSCKIMTYTSSSTGEGASHSHGNTGSTTPNNTGSSSNIPPYKTIYMWQRIA